jgi:hypothetical protein
MWHLGFFETYAVIAMILAGIIIAGKFIEKRPSKILIPRENKSGMGNDAGNMLGTGVCPECKGNEFFQGPYRSIYCGNKGCRAAYTVFNYGPGQIWAERQPEQAPEHLYS